MQRPRECTHVVEDKVDSRELLESLESHSGERPQAVPSGSSLEAVEVSSGSERAFVVDVGSNYGEFLVDLLRIGLGLEDASNG